MASSSPSRSCYVCAEKEAVDGLEACEHLCRASIEGTSPRYHRCFSGRGLGRVALCQDCQNLPPDAALQLQRLCEECMTGRIETVPRLGDWGVPGFPIRDAGLKRFSVEVLRPPDGSRIRQIVSLSALPGSHWLALTEELELLQVEFPRGEWRRIGGVAEMGLPTDEKLMVVASRGGEFAVVAMDKGAGGVVLDLRSSRVTMQLNRGDYHTEHCRFSAAFFEHDGRMLLVHATAWNRLDVSDPATGELLTPREPTAYKTGEDRPSHYLDYFHSALAISPRGEWIADSGWIWHPVGLIAIWNLRRWLTENVWESEDGPSRQYCMQRDYYWNGPLCWTNDERLIAWGVGSDDYGLLPAVRIMDHVAQTGTVLVGPFSPWKPATSAVEAADNCDLAKEGILEFDRYLFSWSPKAGFTAWDIVDGARVFGDMTFIPLAYNRATGEFFSQDEAGHCRLSRLV